MGLDLMKAVATNMVTEVAAIVAFIEVKITAAKIK